MVDMYFHTNQTDWGDFYDSLGRTDLSPAGQPSGELTSRSVRTVAIDPFTGQPVAAGGSGANPATLAALNKQAGGRGLPVDYQQQMNNWAIDNAVKNSTPVRVALDANGQQVQPIGYNPQQDNPAVTAAMTVAQGGNKPSWASPPSRGFQFPVTATPEIRQAAADMVKGVPGAQKRYTMLLADAAPTMGQAPMAPGAPPVAPAKVGPTGVGTNGYTYVNGQNMGYAAEEQAKRITLGKAIAEANRQNPNPTYTVSGDNNAFMPRSVQESVRWQTGN